MYNLNYSFFFLMFIILGCLENFSVDWRTGSAWDVPEIRYGFWEIFKLFKTLLKNSWKVSATFLSFEITVSFSISVTLRLNLILLGERAATFFQDFSDNFYIKVFKIRPFQIPKKTNKNVSLIIVSCFSCSSSFFRSKRFLALFSS